MDICDISRYIKNNKINPIKYTCNAYNVCTIGGFHPNFPEQDFYNLLKTLHYKECRGSAQCTFETGDYKKWITKQKNQPRNDNYIMLDGSMVDPSNNNIDNYLPSGVYYR